MISGLCLTNPYVLLCQTSHFFCFFFQMKKEFSDNESITQEVVGNAHIENYALKLFLYADNEDRAERFHKWGTLLTLLCFIRNASIPQSAVLNSRTHAGYFKNEDQQSKICSLLLFLVCYFFALLVCQLKTLQRSAFKPAVSPMAATSGCFYGRSFQLQHKVAQRDFLFPSF